MKRSSIVLQAAVVVFFAQVAVADDQMPKGSEFVQEAVGLGRGEVKISELAMEMSTDQGIKDLAKQMVESHKKINSELTSIASKQKIVVPKAMMSASAQDKYNDLAKMKGAEFDREFLSTLINDHQKAIKQFEDQSEKGEVPEIKAFATRTLPTLRSHLQKVKAMEDAYKARMGKL